MPIEGLMQLDLGIEAMHYMESTVRAKHSVFRIRHPHPDREESRDGYWSHILVDWLAMHEGYAGPEADSPQEAVLLERANTFLHRYWNLLENEWGDLISGLIWAIEPRVSVLEEE